MSLKPQEWPFEVQKWAFRAIKTRRLRGWDLYQARSLEGFHVLLIERKNRVLIRHLSHKLCRRRSSPTSLRPKPSRISTLSSSAGSMTMGRSGVRIALNRGRPNVGNSKHQELRKGGFSCRVQCHGQGSKKYPTILGYIWHSERHSQERRTFEYKPPSKNPLLLASENNMRWATGGRAMGVPRKKQACFFEGSLPLLFGQGQGCDPAGEPQTLEFRKHKKITKKNKIPHPGRPPKTWKKY